MEEEGSKGQKPIATAAAALQSILTNLELFCVQNCFFSHSVQSARNNPQGQSFFPAKGLYLYVRQPCSKSAGKAVWANARIEQAGITFALQSLAYE